MNKGKSIKGSLVKSFTIGITICFALIFAITFMIVKKDLQNVKQNAVKELVEDASKNIATQIDGMYATAYTIAADPDVYDSSKGFEEKKDRLVEYAASRSINSIGYITAAGYLTSTDGFENDISERDYFKDMMNGGKYISNPSFNTATNSQIIFIGVPIYENGKIVSSMTCTFDSSYMSEVISVLNYLGEGEAYMLSSTGTVIASPDMDQVLNKYNVIEAAQEDASLQNAAAIHQTMLDTESGTLTLDKHILVYCKVPNTNGWTLVFKLPVKSFAREVSGLVTVFIFFAIIGIALVIVISVLIGNGLGNRLLRLKDNLTEVAEGNFTVHLDEKELEAKDEIGIIYQSVQSTLDAIDGTLTSMKIITDKLANQAVVLDNTSKQLSVGTQTVTTSMDEIQKGNTEQASEIENINTEMEKFNSNVETVDTNISGVVEATTDATKKLRTSNTEMKELQDSFSTFNTNFTKFREIIDAMNDSLSSINMITSTIADIADQTNLLSLNASIEAARAGEVGRGFSVVAQEISKLAEQCSASVGDISNVVVGIMDNGKQLVDSTSAMGEQIQTQNSIVNETLESFDQLTKYMEDMLPQMQDISKISKENLKASKTIGDSIQNANAISEELAATTVEVGNTSDDFLKSSANVNDAAAHMLDLSDELSKLTSQFKI